MISLSRVLLIASSVALVTSCSQGKAPVPGDGSELRSEQSFRLTGKVVNGKTHEPIANSVVTIEVGGIYVFNPAFDKGNPRYQFGVLSGADGFFSVVVPATKIGIHTYSDGFKYGGVDGHNPVEAANLDGYLIEQEPLKKEPSDPEPHVPTLAGFKITPSRVAPGGSVRVEVDATQTAPYEVEENGVKRMAEDPLSDEVLAVQADTSFAVALDPPRPRSSDHPGSPDGHYTKTIVAPKVRGTYTYYLVATSEGCTNANRLVGELIVE